MTKIAVTGSTGAVGGTAALLLAEAGVEQRLLVRDASRAPHLPGADVVEADYADGLAVSTALKDVDTLFMVSAPEHHDRVKQHQTVIEAAVASGVRQVVYLSFIGAAVDAPFTFAREHGETEDYLRGCGLSWTFLRDNFYAELLPQLAIDDLIRGPAGDGRVAAVAQADVGAVVAQVMQDPRMHEGRTYDLTGPEAISLHDVAEVLTEITGRPHRYETETLEEAYERRNAFGAPAELLDAWINVYTSIAQGSFAHVSGDVDRLLHRPATPFDEAVARLQA